MRTRLHTWLDKKRWVPMYGVQVYAHSKWCHVSINGKAQMFDTEKEAEGLRAEMRKRKPPSSSTKGEG